VPSVLLDAFVARAPDLQDVSMVHLHTEGPGPDLAPEMAGRFREGRAIIALPSTAAGGAASRIVPFLQEGAGVITTRGQVRTVVTEWGVAELFGKTLGERARALIGIAHPDYRDGLTAAARERRLI